MKWEDSVNLGVRDEEHVALIFSQGKTRFNNQRAPALFVPTAEMPEPTLEWAVSRARLGLRELFCF